MTGTLLMEMLINQLADTMILFLVRQKKFPDKNILRVMAGGLIASLTYMVWKNVTVYCPVWGRLMLAVLLISMVLAGVFQIRCPGQLLLVWYRVLFYAFILGGASLAVVRLSSSLLPLNRVISPALVFLIVFVRSLALPGRDGGRDQRTGNLYQVEIRRGVKRVRCSGLYDSGNLLKSRVTGEGICVIDEKRGQKLLTEEEGDSLRKGRLLAQKNIYPVIYHSISEDRGEMPGIVADEIIVSRMGKTFARKKGMVGIYPGKLAGDGRFSALLPEDIFS